LDALEDDLSMVADDAPVSALGNPDDVANIARAALDLVMLGPGLRWRRVHECHTDQHRQHDEAVTRPDRRLDAIS
jgi:hypothetical protein